MVKKLINKKIIYALCILLCFSLLIKSCSKKQSTKFPKLKLGAYSGEIKIKNATYPILISSFEDLNILSIANNGLNSTKIDLSNLKINLAEKEYKLVGKKYSENYTGEVLLGDKIVGNWNLKKIKTKLSSVNRDPELVKAITDYYTLRTQAKAVREEEIDLRARIENYKNAIPKEEAIRVLALNEIEDLKYLLEEKKDIRNNLKKDLKTKINDLEQLQRITTLGRVVELARRTTKREDRWYLANWGEGSYDESQQQVAESLGVDLNKLDEKLKLAEEYINLKNSISQEARRIEDLRNFKSAPVIATPTIENKVNEKPKVKDKSIWNKIGDAFGL